jgi:tetratricopeptide (TPR) repeat protein
LSRTRYLTVLLALLGLVGCSTAPGASGDRDAAPEFDPDLDYHLLLGEIALGRNQFEEAARQYAAAARLSTDPDVAAQATALSLRVGLEQLAFESARRWVELDPASMDAHRYLGVLYVARREPEPAAAHLTRVIEDGGEPAEQTFRYILRALNSLNEWRATADTMALLVESYPDEPMAQFAMANAAMLAGDADRALEAADRLMALRPDWPAAYLTRAQALVATGQREEGLALARTLAEETDDPQLQVDVAGLMVAAGADDEARALLARLLRDDPGRPDALRALALLELRTGDREAAAEHWMQLRGGPYADEAHFYLGRIAIADDQSQRALRFFSRVTEGPYAAQAQVLAAELLLEQRGIGAALQHLTEFGRASPRHADDMLAARARLLVGDGRPVAALDLYDAALAERPEDSELRAGRVRVYAAAAATAGSDGRDEEALEWYARGLEAHPAEPLLLYQRALFFERNGRLDRAIEELERLVELEPESPLYLNALGYTLADRTDQYERARDLIEQALAGEPDNPAILDSMGWVLYKLGDLDGALEYLERAWSLLRDPEVAAHIVTVRQARGEAEAAQGFLAEALAEWPEDERLRALADEAP